MPLDFSCCGPPPPPKLTDPGDDRPRRDQPFITPSLLFLDRQTREVWRGMYTIRYEVMTLWDPCYVSVSADDDMGFIEKLKSVGLPLIRTTKVGSPTYADWLLRWHPAGLILPHIQWGGHIESTLEGDGGAGFTAWKLYALTLN